MTNKPIDNMDQRVARRIADELELADMTEQLPFTLNYLQATDRELTELVNGAKGAYGAYKHNWPASSVLAIADKEQILVHQAQKYCRELAYIEELRESLDYDETPIG